MAYPSILGHGTYYVPTNDQMAQDQYAQTRELGNNSAPLASTSRHSQDGQSRHSSTTLNQGGFSRNDGASSFNHDLWRPNQDLSVYNYHRLSNDNFSTPNAAIFDDPAQIQFYDQATQGVAGWFVPATIDPRVLSYPDHAEPAQVTYPPSMPRPNFQAPLPTNSGTLCRETTGHIAGSISGPPISDGIGKSATPKSQSRALQLAANSSAKISRGNGFSSGQPLRQMMTTNSTNNTTSNTTSVQPFPVMQRNGILLEAKRKALAEAIVKALNANPANSRNPIRLDELLGILAQNPTYVQLCILLERRGFKFDRGSLARQLLNNVPDLTATQSQQTAPLIRSQAEPSVTSRQSSVLVSANPVLHAQLQKSKLPVQSAEAVFPVGTAKDSVNPEIPRGSKAATARKRTFSEIADLDQLSDHDNEADLLPNQPPTALPISDESRPPPIPSTSKPHPPGIPQKPRSIAPVVKSLDEKEVLRKSYYDSKTVARDILIAAGRHPTENPLNYHLATIMTRTSSLSVTPQADLSTFDWDAIDPGGPPMPRVEEVEIENTPPELPISSMPGRPAPQNSMNSGTIENSNATSSSLLTAQLSLNQASTLTKSLLENSLRQKKPISPTSSRDVIKSSDLRPEPLGRAPSSSRPSLHTNEASSPAPMINTGTGSGSRHGRPPGSKNKSSAIAGPREPVPQVEVVAEESPPDYQTYRCRWRGCAAKLHNLSTLRKHVAKIHTKQTTKFECWWERCTLLQKVDDDWSVSKSFATQEELLKHLDTQHLRPISWEFGDGPSDVPVGKIKTSHLNLACFAYNPALSSLKPAPHLTSSSTKTQFFQSLDPQTLERQRKTYTSDASGRQVTPIFSLRPTKDAPLDPIHLPIQDRKSWKSYLKTHATDKNKGKHLEAEELLRAMTWKKERTGPGIDRGGATLITPELRATFVGDENIMRIVDDGEDSDAGTVLR